MKSEISKEELEKDYKIFKRKSKKLYKQIFNRDIEDDIKKIKEKNNA